MVYVGSSAWFGNKMFALDASSGQVLWSYPSVGSLWAGPAIANGTVYWGSGYYQALGSKKFYAFSIGGH